MALGQCGIQDGIVHHSALSPCFSPSECALKGNGLFNMNIVAWGLALRGFASRLPKSLRNYFDKFGEIKETMVMKDPQTKRSRGFGFVTYRDPASVDKVLASGPHSIDSKTVPRWPYTLIVLTPGQLRSVQAGGCCAEFQFWTCVRSMDAALETSPPSPTDSHQRAVSSAPNEALKRKLDAQATNGPFSANLTCATLWLASVTVNCTTAALLSNDLDLFAQVHLASVTALHHRPAAAHTRTVSDLPAVSCHPPSRARMDNQYLLPLPLQVDPKVAFPRKMQPKALSTCLTQTPTPVLCVDCPFVCGCVLSSAMSGFGLGSTVVVLLPTLCTRLAKNTLLGQRFSPDLVVNSRASFRHQGVAWCIGG
ncbi:hypothetical protein BaRGS_00014726 [Batillaria attramentaria]|uniref:RRM domain-containing protein n=1 Tax=Batillaria attramentaria TaxID=370345 RepID=A0ABD0L431_9CAEN